MKLSIKDPVIMFFSVFVSKENVKEKFQRASKLLDWSIELRMSGPVDRSDRWMRESVNALKGAIEKFQSAREGDFKQALIIADNATESIMRNYLIFICSKNPPYEYPKLLKEICTREKIPLDAVETIKTFRLIRDGFFHQNIEKITKGLKGSTIGLTLEQSYLEDYLDSVCKLFQCLTGIEIEI